MMELTFHVGYIINIYIREKYYELPKILTYFWQHSLDITYRYIRFNELVTNTHNSNINVCNISCLYFPIDILL